MSELFSIVSWEFNDEKINKAVEMGFDNPYDTVESIFYSGNENDVITFDSDKNGEELFNSMSHSGFQGCEINYQRIQYSWNDFFDDLDYTEYLRTIKVKLKGNNIYEEDIVDEYEKHFRYYDENVGIFYEVSELMLGNFIDENAKLTKKIMGNSSLFKGIDGVEAPTYDPLILEVDENIINYDFTMLDDEPVIYMETKRNEKLHKKWISIKNGILKKEFIFDVDGLLIDSKILVSIEEEEIDDSVFYEPEDVDYKDITLFLFSFLGGDVETLVRAVETTIPTEPAGIILTGENGSKFTIQTQGMEDMKIAHAIYISKVSNIEDKEVFIKEFKAKGRFYTVCDELGIVEIYDKSCCEKKFFNFEDVGLIGVSENESGKNYSFYDPNNISVSGLYDVYEYVINDYEISKIITYTVDSLRSGDESMTGEPISYSISFIPFDESAYDESFVNYKTIDYGENSFNDGEHMPFWYDIQK